jgi:glycosyltransferase involved in cell wall biosynthesis
MPLSTILPLPLSIFIITKNEADRLPATLEAIKGLSDDVIVVDSGSTDTTQTITENWGARFLMHDWRGYGPQKRFAEEQCRHAWLLNLDADEVISPPLADEIRDLWANGAPPHEGYRLAIREIFPGEKEPHRFAYTLYPVRLYRRDRGRYSASPVHDRVDMAAKARIGRLKGAVHHYSVRSLGDQIAKLNHYSDQQADDLDARGITIPTWRLFFEYFAAFLKAYFGRRHCLRGVYGFLTAMNYAFSRHLRLAKHYERRRMKEKTSPKNVGLR